MKTRLRLRHLLAISVATLAVACANVLGFPDRTLDEQGADGGPGANEAAAPIPPGVTFSKPAIDFGLVPCGGATPPTQDVTLANGTTAALTWTATLSETADFTISGPTTGTIAANATGTISVAAAPVAQTTEAGSTSQATLTVVTNHPDKPKIDLPIKLTAGGGTLAVVPLTVAFGEASVGKPAADIPIAIKNTGNQSVQIAFTPLQDPQFTLAWGGSPAPITLAPNAATTDLVARFTPDKIASSTAATAIGVIGAVCGTTATGIAFSGKGSPSNAAVQPGALDFSTVDCGTAAKPQTVTVVNSGSAPLTWNTTTPTSGNYALDKLSGTVPGNTSEIITVTPKQIPIPSEVTPNLYGDTLTITTDAVNDVPHVVDLRMTAQGAILERSSGAIDFSSVRVNTTELAPFIITNSGNVQSALSFVVSDGAFAVTPPNAVLTGGASLAFSASFTPTEKKTYNGLLTLDAGGAVLCKPLPAGITLTGKGATSATVTPANVGFGQNHCGTQAGPKNVVLTNIGAESFTWTASIGTTYYGIAPTSGTLAATQTATIVVTPIAIPATSSTVADFYADTLTIQTTPAFESPYTAQIHMTAKGAILGFSPTSVPFGNVAVNGSSTKPFNVTNTGNLDAPVTLAVTSSSANTFAVNPTTKTVKATAGFNAIFTPKSTGNKTGQVGVTTTVTTCAPLPANMQLTGNGT